MDGAGEDRADAWFHALSDRTRRDILRRVLAGEHSVSRLAASYDMSFAAVQKHVAVLEKAGLLTKRRQGREALASGDVAAVRSVGAMLGPLPECGAGRQAAAAGQQGSAGPYGPLVQMAYIVTPAATPAKSRPRATFAA